MRIVGLICTATGRDCWLASRRARSRAGLRGAERKVSQTTDYPAAEVCAGYRVSGVVCAASFWGLVLCTLLVCVGASAFEQPLKESKGGKGEDGGDEQSEGMS